jgi:hypothetical protein
MTIPPIALNALTFDPPLSIGQASTGFVQGQQVGSVITTTVTGLNILPDGRYYFDGSGSAGTVVGGITETTGSTNRSTDVSVYPNLGPTTASFPFFSGQGTVIAPVTGLAAGEAVVRLLPGDGRVRMDNAGANLIVDRTVSRVGATEYTYITNFGRKRRVTVSVAAPADLGPTTTSFAVGAAAGTIIAPVTGLSNSEVVTFIAPNDGRIAVDAGGTNLIVGLTVSSAGTTNYTYTTSAGRSQTVAVSAISYALLNEDGSPILNEDGTYLQPEF